MKKKILTILLCSVLVLGLTGCGKEKFENKQEESTSDDFDIYITKSDWHDHIKFNDYYTSSDRTIYLSGNLEEFYIVDLGENMTLKYYLENANQSFDNSIKSITNQLDLKDGLNDGGTKIYKSKDKDITMIVCNTTKGDKNIFIGDYSMEYMDGDCKN